MKGFAYFIKEFSFLSTKISGKLIIEWKTEDQIWVLEDPSGVCGKSAGER